MYDAFKSITRGRASLERDRVVFGAMVEDSELEDFLDDTNVNVNESVDDEEINILIDKIPETSEEEEENQINRILDSDEDLDVDEVLGVDPDDSLSDL